MTSVTANALNDGTVDVVLIGHSKTFVPYNEKTLEPFLRWLSKNVYECRGLCSFALL